MTEPVTIIGSNTVIRGNLEGDEDLTIEGRVEGTITLSKTLSIEGNGVVHANINVRNAVISGVLVGNVEAEDSVHITEEGRVMGDIRAPRVILVDGASFRGSIDMGDFEVERGDLSAATPRPERKPAPRTAPAYRQEPETAPVSAAAAPAEPEPDIARQPEPRRMPTRVRTAPSSASQAARAAAAKRAAASAKKADAPAPTPAKKPAPAPSVRTVKKAKASRKKR